MRWRKGFSALQRAENSSIGIQTRPVAYQARFSALQRAENSSMSSSIGLATRALNVSVLFSEPKIPQYPVYRLQYRIELRFQCSSASRKFLNISLLQFKLRRAKRVSVLFSEPKIPQFFQQRSQDKIRSGFSALQRAENSSMSSKAVRHSRRFAVSVLFSEPKIPQSRPSHLRPSIFPTAMITLRHS